MTRSHSRAGRWAGWGSVALLATGLMVAWLVLDPGFRGARDIVRTAVAQPENDFERRVREYLLRNPEVIVEAMRALEERQRAAEDSEAQSVLASRSDEVFRDPASPVGGNPEGDLTLVELADYNCPYCRRVAPVMVEAERSDPQLRIVYKEFPILGPNSAFAARAALAAHAQGKYVEFHRSLMGLQGAADEASVLRIATEIGIDVARMKSDMEKPEIKSAIERNLALAQALRITGTPSFVIGERIVRGAIDLATMQAHIREARKRD